MGLVLSRHRDEWIDIAGGVSAGGMSVCVVDIRGDKVRLLIEAPEKITVHRREIQNAIERAASGDSATVDQAQTPMELQSVTELSPVATDTTDSGQEE